MAIIGLWLANLAAFSLRPEQYRVDIGNFRDDFWLAGTYPIEAADGRTYRWTAGRATLEIFSVQHTQPTVMEIYSGPRPTGTSVDLLLNGQPWVSMLAGPGARVARLLLPPDAPQHLLIEMLSSTFKVPGDPRDLGFILDAFSLRVIGNGPVAPSAELMLAQIGILLGVQLMAMRLGAGWRGQLLIMLAVAAGVAIIAVSVLPLSYIYLLRLAVAAAMMACLTWIFLPLAERHLRWAGSPRQIRILWALTLVAVAIRLTGVLFPTFGGQDLGRNLKRLNTAINGEHVIIGASSEFADGQTIYPTGPYIAIMPWLIATDDQGSVMQGVLATMDGFTALFVGLLALRLGGSQTAARLAIILYAGSLTAFSVMIYSFSAQIFGQWFTAPILLLLCQPGALDQPRSWLLAITTLAFGVFSHIGVAILGIAWFGVLITLMLLFRRDSPGLRWGIGALAVMLLGSVAFLYSSIVIETLSHIGSLSHSGGNEAGPLLKGASHLLWKGVRLAFTEAGVLLLPPALVLFYARPPSSDAVLAVSAMLLTALVFFLVDLTLYLQVRYLYFMLPLALAAMARLLGLIAAKGSLGRVGAWALCLALTIATVSMWYGNTWGDYQITMTPLTH
ncbi:hypothetical protein EKD04_003545 [Chloroflexales bacterium ZM16-3]|nr:hypothetical protein [Chloroflexales bacterium ZM16-3]